MPRTYFSGDFSTLGTLEDTGLNRQRQRASSVLRDLRDSGADSEALDRGERIIESSTLETIGRVINDLQIQLGELERDRRQEREWM